MKPRKESKIGAKIILGPLTRRAIAIGKVPNRKSYKGKTYREIYEEAIWE